MITISDNLCGKSLLLAVSGGLDSVCLLDFFAKNAKALQIARLGVAHIDHGIRGAASAEDAEFVRSLALRYDLPFFFKALGGVLQHVSNQESKAREMRYEFLQNVRAAENFDYIVTAHHGDDQAETLYMRLARGTSFAGLRGVKKFREDCIYRPFLSIFRSDLADYAALNGLNWREDSTNENNAYRRNFVRNLILPRLENSAPGFKRTLCKIADVSNAVYEKILLNAKSIFDPLEILPEFWKFPKEVSPFARVLALQFDTLNATLAKLGEGGEELFRLWLISRGFDVPAGSAHSPIFPLPQNRLCLRGRIAMEKSLNCLWIMDLHSKRDCKNLYFFAAKNEPEGEWRYRKDGDVYSPEGMLCKRRKLCKWLQERGIPLFVRDHLPLLAKGSQVLRIAKSSDFEDFNK